MRLTPEDQRARGETFRDLHHGGEPLLLPNPWDAGTARILTGMGFRALATTSAGLAFSLGRPDGANQVSREETLANAEAIVAATHLPVSADLESGFGGSPDEVAETIRLAAEVGLVGGSIEDATGDPDDPVYPLPVAVERLAAAVEAAQALPFPFTLVGRAENFLHGRPDLDDTVRRLRAYEEAGADVLYAPGLPDASAVRTVCAAVDRPVNVLGGGPTPARTVAELAACGVRRISLGSALSRAALSAMERAAGEMLNDGRLDVAVNGLSHGELNTLMAARLEAP